MNNNKLKVIHSYYNNAILSLFFKKKFKTTYYERDMIS